LCAPVLRARLWLLPSCRDVVGPEVSLRPRRLVRIAAAGSSFSCCLPPAPLPTMLDALVRLDLLVFLAPAYSSTAFRLRVSRRGGCCCCCCCCGRCCCCCCCCCGRCFLLRAAEGTRFTGLHLFSSSYLCCAFPRPLPFGASSTKRSSSTFTRTCSKPGVAERMQASDGGCTCTSKNAGTFRCSHAAVTKLCTYGSRLILTASAAASTASNAV
jgi:hypothetical protein